MHILDVANFKLKKILHQFPAVIKVDLLKLMRGGTALCLEAEVCSMQGFEGDVDPSQQPESQIHGNQTSPEKVYIT